MKWHEDYIRRVEQSIQAAEKQLSRASYISECTENAGLRAIYSKQATWLADVVYAASCELERQKNGYYEKVNR